MHTPLYSKELYDNEVKKEGDPAYLMAVPEELMKDYSPHRFEQQLADDVTREAYNYIINSTTIKAILTGHLHCDYECVLNGSVKQLVTGVSTLREIYIC